MTLTEINLTGKQKRYLRGLGSTQESIIQIGKGGVVPGIVQQAEEALEARELVKVRVLNNCPEETKEVAGQLSQKVGAALVQVIGHTFLLFRPSVKKPEIQLPQ